MTDTSVNNKYYSVRGNCIPAAVIIDPTTGDAMTSLGSGGSTEMDYATTFTRDAGNDDRISAETRTYTDGSSVTRAYGYNSNGNLISIGAWS